MDCLLYSRRAFILMGTDNGLLHAQIYVSLGVRTLDPLEFRISFESD
jgi:hypothetical protein